MGSRTIHKAASVYSASGLLDDNKQENNGFLLHRIVF